MTLKLGSTLDSNATELLSTLSGDLQLQVRLRFSSFRRDADSTLSVWGLDAWRTNETLKTALESFFTNETAMNSTRTGQFIRDCLDQPDGRIPVGLSHWPLTRLVGRFIRRRRPKEDKHLTLLSQSPRAGNGLRHYMRHRQHPVRPPQSGASPTEGPPPRNEFRVGTRKHRSKFSRVLRVI